MSDLDVTLRKFDSLTRRWKQGDARSFQDCATLLTLALAIRRQAAEEALKLPDCFDREIFVRMRNAAAETEKSVRGRLAARAYTPGDAA